MRSGSLELESRWGQDMSCLSGARVVVTLGTGTPVSLSSIHLLISPMKYSENTFLCVSPCVQLGTGKGFLTLRTCPQTGFPWEKGRALPRDI